MPLAEEPIRLDRHRVSVRGQFSGASTSAIDGLISPAASFEATYAAGVSASPVSTAAWAWSARSSGFTSNCG